LASDVVIAVAYVPAVGISVDPVFTHEEYDGIDAETV